MLEKTDQLDYRECIVTFLDILGFKTLLSSRSSKDIAEILSVFRLLSRNGDPSSLDGCSRAATPSSIRIEIVSDAIVRIRPNFIHPLTKTSELFDELLILKEIQIECLQRGILLRGAMTVGQMYVDIDPSGPVFGPALVEAVEMEGREVIYPRIAVHSDVVERHKNSDDATLAESYEADQEMVSLLLTQDGAGLHYLDYIRILFDDLNWCDEEVFDFLRSHKKLIDEGLRIRRGVTRRKYTWLRDYHNTSLDHAVASRWINLGEVKKADWEKLRITS